MNNQNEIAQKILAAKKRLKKNLKGLNINQIDISDYNKRYLSNKLKKIDGTLDTYGDLLKICFHDTELSLRDTVLVDYGGGSGILSFLAKEFGIGTIIYVDIFHESCNDVRVLSNYLKLPLNYIVNGNIDELLIFLQKNSLIVNAIASYDVLEHIYDIDDHFKKLSSINAPFRIVYASGANIKNPYISKNLKKQQLLAEYHDRREKWGHKQRDTLKAYFDIRKEIIHLYSPKLDSVSVNLIAKVTRGLQEADIKKCVDEYIEKGQINYSIDHPTNTCDPYTGNWCEHLIRTDWFEQNISKYGYSVKILNGHWNATSTIPKKAISKILNLFIKALGNNGLIIAPYYIVVADHYEK